jgi:hypothetical protein
VTDVINWINNHEKVCTVFDKAQVDLGHEKALAYLVAGITRWTTHFTAFACLLELKEPLSQSAFWKWKDIIKAQVGAATSTEMERLTKDANSHCDLCKDKTFWVGLEQICGDIEVICYATNLSQKDSTRANQVLLSLVGVSLHFSEHPEPEVAWEMLVCIEKHWCDTDQLLFLLMLILNPWEQLSCFGDDAGMDHFTVCDMVIQVYIHI